MSYVVLGNSSVILPVKTGNTTEIERVPKPELGNQETIFDVPDHVPVGVALTEVSSVFRSHHSDAPPAWVAGEDKVLVAALAREFNCPVGRPSGWGSEPKPVAKDGD